MKALSMTFKVNRDRGIGHQVTHLNGTDKDGINLYVCEFNEKHEQVKSVINISLDEFKRNNKLMYEDMIKRKKEQECNESKTS